MQYIAWFVFFFTLLQLLIAFVNLLFMSKLPPGNKSDNPLVSVLIPARNEEKKISNVLEDILHQDYCEIEVIVFNDQSDDATAEIVTAFARRDNRISIINADRLPEGWLGKNRACHILSQRARGEYFLFLDADVRVGNKLIVNAISYMDRFGLALVSIFPKQIIKTLGEKITVPVMNYILLTLLPLVLVRKSVYSSLAAANGQFMLFNSKVYKALYPHEKMRINLVEDIEIARYLKKERYKIACLAGDSAIQCRMYSGLKDAVRGFSKNVSAFFGNSILLAFLFWLITTFGFIFVLCSLSFPLFLTYISIYILIRIIVSVISEQNAVENLLLIFPQQMSLGLFMYYAFINKKNKTYHWKGRDIKS
ncbi:MAG: glycosyltransferase [Bacteroidales bacterium]|nr:glycosyltransferase [Bacteroidales bacterium]